MGEIHRAVQGVDDPAAGGLYGVALPGQAGVSGFRGSRSGRGRRLDNPLPCRLFRQKAVVREVLLNHPDDEFLAFVVGLGHRIDGPLHGDLMGLVVILAHHRARGQGGLPPDLGDFIRHGFDSYLSGSGGFFFNRRWTPTPINK